MKCQQQRQRNPKRLPALLPGLAQLSTIKTAVLPGLPRFLMLGAYLEGRVSVYAVPPGTHWQLTAPEMPIREAEQLERKHGAAFLAGTRLTLTAPGYRPAVLPINAVRVLRETLEALEQLEAAPLALPPAERKRSA